MFFTKLSNANLLIRSRRPRLVSTARVLMYVAASLLFLSYTYTILHTLNSLCQAHQVVIKVAALISAISLGEKCHCFPPRNEKCRCVANDAQVQGRTVPATLNWLAPRQREPTGACGPHTPHTMLQPVHFNISLNDSLQI
jgi:hypothetical protein